MITLITSSDYLDLYNLNHAIFSNYEAYSENTIKFLADNKAGYLLRENNISIGYILYGILDGLFMIISFGILKEFRNQGYGKQLLKHFLSLQNKPIYLHVRTSNHVAKKLYEFVGFRDKKIEINLYIDEDGILMELL